MSPFYLGFSYVGEWFRECPKILFRNTNPCLIGSLVENFDAHLNYTLRTKDVYLCKKKYTVIYLYIHITNSFLFLFY